MGVSGVSDDGKRRGTNLSNTSPSFFTKAIVDIHCNEDMVS